MIREVDLVSYLPAFLAEFAENTAALEAENPEFKLAWEASDKVLKNEFIETADEYGIARFEKFLGIVPDKESDLEARRENVRILWNYDVPFTRAELYRKLDDICGSEDAFELVEKYYEYMLEVYTHLEAAGTFDAVGRLLEEMVPCNMEVLYDNTVYLKDCPLSVYFGGVGCVSEHVKVYKGV